MFCLKIINVGFKSCFKIDTNSLIVKCKPNENSL